MVRHKKLKIFIKQCRLLYKRFAQGRGKQIGGAFLIVMLIWMWFSSGDPPLSCKNVAQSVSNFCSCY